MSTPRLKPPAAHGEVLIDPPYEQWPELLAHNRAAAREWRFRVAGRTVGDVRDLARREALALAWSFSQRIGVPVAPPRQPDGPIVVTGHQPELFHPGVWVKNFLLQKFAAENTASAVDIVVDSDTFERVELAAPCIDSGLLRCRRPLALGAPGRAFASSPVPEPEEIEDFAAAGIEVLAKLESSEPRTHFSAFTDSLREASAEATTLAELITFARRRHEMPVGHDYLELPVTTLVCGGAWAAFVADIALNADRFAECCNGALGEYRRTSGTRSAAEPFPDLDIRGDLIELPLWAIADGGRTSVWARRTGDEVELVAEERVLGRLVRNEEDPGAMLRDVEATIVPKALSLTLFTRVFVADLFIHGLGGERYDAVTDEVCRRYYGIEPPQFVVATMSMRLPLPADPVSDEQVASAKDRVNRLIHNPDAFLADARFDDDGQRRRAADLATEKAALIVEINGEGADRKTIGLRIRDINKELAAMLAPLRAKYQRELDELVQRTEAAEAMTDRTYPFCLWSAEQVADAIR